MPASAVRILVAGDREGLPDLVEVRRLPEGAPFTLAVQRNLGPAVSKWAASSCDGWHEVRQTGLPQGWHLFGAEGVRCKAGSVAPLPLLSLPAKTGLVLRGAFACLRTPVGTSTSLLQRSSLKAQQQARQCAAKGRC